MNIIKGRPLKMRPRRIQQEFIERAPAPSLYYGSADGLARPKRRSTWHGLLRPGTAACTAPDTHHQ